MACEGPTDPAIKYTGWKSIKNIRLKPVLC